MKFAVILIILLFCNPLFGQIEIDPEKLRIQPKEIPESAVKLDSSYCNYYRSQYCNIAWFQSNSSVIRCKTTAFVSPYYNKCRYWFRNKPAQGKAEVVIGSDPNNCRMYSGTFKNGFYDTGKLEVIENGCAIYSGEFKDNAKTGHWIERSETGNIIEIAEYDERLEFPVRKWKYDENGELLDLTDESQLLGY